MEIYIVTSGCYSDYGINAVFSTREKAQEYCDMHNNSSESWDSYSVETYAVDEPYEEIPCVVMVKPCNGSVKAVLYSENEEGEYFPSCFDMDETVKDVLGTVFVKVRFSKDKEAMRKSAIDYYYAYMAKKEGL